MAGESEGTDLMDEEKPENTPDYLMDAFVYAMAACPVLGLFLAVWYDNPLFLFLCVPIILFLS